MKLTNKGQTLQAKAQAGTMLQFTRLAIGDGNLGSTDPLTLNALISQKKSLQVKKLESLTGGKAVVGSSFTNADVTTGFDMRELGVFAQDPDVGEILYMYGNAGNTADFIPPGSGGGSDVLERALNVVTIVGTAANVTAVIDQSLVFATAAQLGDLSTSRRRQRALRWLRSMSFFNLPVTGRARSLPQLLARVWRRPAATLSRRSQPRSVTSPRMLPQRQETSLRARRTTRTSSRQEPCQTGVPLTCHLHRHSKPSRQDTIRASLRMQ
ncbi:phage tail protein [Paenibacillus sp. P22]|uniref:phage tail-collar fiber domain-containing protein n=1 Tax=Paenibacillus sp. P22 TaxID=483908 RepID=UPI0035B50DCF